MPLTPDATLVEVEPTHDLWPARSAPADAFGSRRRSGVVLLGGVVVTMGVLWHQQAIEVDAAQTPAA